ncbi:MAG: GTPase ObgE [Oscillospiraceae bacterium]
MFVDLTKIKLKAGDGGNGAITFHREKYVAAGGPDGGDGGKGGDIIFLADTNLSTLLDFKFKKKFVAANGENGQTKRCSGKSAENLVIRVPKGTLVKEAKTGRILADMSSEEAVVIAKGGKGGWGNQHFATPTRQIPRFAKSGLPGESIEILLELKLLADVGLVGFPNVGKSTLISTVSEAKPTIANYHFTTLTPVLGVVQTDSGKSFVMADIPGLIEGASEGAGLGHEFLRHVERCRLIVHVVDISGIEGRDPIEDFDLINKELKNFDAELAERPQIVAGNKADMATEEQIQKFKDYVESKGYDFFVISAATTQGVKQLINKISTKLESLPPIKEYEIEGRAPQVCATKPDSNFEIEIDDDDVYVLKAKWLIPVFGMVDVNDNESLQYMQRVLIETGVISKLEEMGIEEGDTVSILNFEFDYVK